MRTAMCNDIPWVEKYFSIESRRRNYIMRIIINYPSKCCHNRNFFIRSVKVFFERKNHVELWFSQKHSWLSNTWLNMHEENICNNKAILKHFTPYKGTSLWIQQKDLQLFIVLDRISIGDELWAIYFFNNVLHSDTFKKKWKSGRVKKLRWFALTRVKRYFFCKKE